MGWLKQIACAGLLFTELAQAYHSLKTASKHGLASQPSRDEDVDRAEQRDLPGQQIRIAAIEDRDIPHPRLAGGDRPAEICASLQPDVSR